MADNALDGWADAFLNQLERGSIAGLVQLMQSQATAHAGTAPAKIKRQAIQIIRKRVENPADLRELAQTLCLSEDATAQEVGCILLAHSYPSNDSDTQQIVHAILQTLSDSENWEVREWAASACGEILTQHFATFLPSMTDWAKSPAENVRRAVVLALMYAGHTLPLTFAKPILDLIETFLTDESIYVRDNLGPFAIGSTLIKAYPEQVLARLPRWLESSNEQLRWNIAMVFSAAEGAKYAVQAKPILQTLSTDERPYIRRAFKRALRQIQKRDPNFQL